MWTGLKCYGSWEFCLFMYDVLNSDVTSYGYMASIGRMASECRVWKVWRDAEVTVLRSSPGSHAAVLNEATTNITEDSRSPGRKTQDLKNMNQMLYTVCPAGVVCGCTALCSGTGLCSCVVFRRSQVQIWVLRPVVCYLLHSFQTIWLLPHVRSL